LAGGRPAFDHLSASADGFRSIGVIFCHALHVPRTSYKRESSRSDEISGAHAVVGKIAGFLLALLGDRPAEGPFDGLRATSREY